MPSLILVTLALLWTTPGGEVQEDPIAPLVAQLEKAASAGDRDGIRKLGAGAAQLDELVYSLTTPQPSRIVIKERDRTRIGENGHRLLLEVFWERGLEGRLATWTVDVAEESDRWVFASATRLAHVAGLYRLALDNTRQFDVRDLVVRDSDLAIHLKAGTAFLAETPEGVTAVVLLGRGEARFTPPDPAERTQLRIFAGSDSLNAAFDAVFLRVRPDEFASRFPGASLVEQPPNATHLRRATSIFEEYLERTLHIDLMDLSSERWSITPLPGDMIAEIRTRRYGSLTYTRSNGDPEDITLFDRRRRKNISVYASAEKLATRGRFYSEDERVDYDVLAYDVDTAIVPERARIDGTTRMKIRIRAASATTLNLRLAESLVVRGVFSPAHGRLLHLRSVNQNSLIVSLPGTMLEGSELWLSISYGGTLASQDLDREAVQVSQDVLEPVQLPPEPRYLYSNRTYWYPQAIVPDYATATIRITVPEGHDVVATGLPTGPPAPPPGVVEGPSRRVFVFATDRPVRYLACVISRFRDLGQMVAKREDSQEDVALNVVSNPRQVGRARGLSTGAAQILAFYTGLIGDIPYPGFTIAFTERELPGGHSPAYFAVVDQPQRGIGSWRNDPVNFDNYPSFFMAHEIAHQWWGQAVGGKNYHEQWLSEGFAQYFAALYAEKHLSADVVGNVLRQMRRTAIRQSEKGPVYLGYRLGHVQSDSRVFRSIVYNKAAMVLHMLRRMVGDDAFFLGIRDFYTRFKYGKAGTDDLIAAMEHASGRDLSRFFDTWIFDVVIPEVRFTHRQEGSRLLLRLEQGDAPTDFPLTVRVLYRSGRTESVTMVASERVTEQSIELSEPLQSVTANADSGSLVVVR